MKKIKKLSVFVSIIIAVTIFCIWQNNDIVTHRYDYKSSKISKNLSGFKIVQISDLHNKEFGKNQIKLMNIIKREKPDMIVVTGDIVDGNHTDLDPSLEFISGAVKIANVYYVTGNHEYWIGTENYNKLMKGMASAGVTILDNKSIEIKYNQDSFYLNGLDDRALIDDTLSNLNINMHEDKLQMLLVHKPQNIELFSKHKMDFVFSGHAHGGQVRLPFIGGLVAPDQGLFPKYTAGEYSCGNTTMEVSRGLGNSIIPIRIFNRPEVVVVTLKK